MSICPPWSDEYELLCEALNYKRMGQVTLLLSKNSIKVNSETENLHDSPLHLAVRGNIVEVVEVLLSKYADVHARGRNGRIPLHLAAANGNKEIAKLLLSNRSKPDSRDDDGVVPLHIAAEKGFISVIKELLNYGASINLPSMSSLHNGYTALHHATENGHLKVAEFLLEKGADVNAQEKYGATALHFSADKRRESIMQLLICHGACVNQACTSGWQKGYTPLHYISESENDSEYLAKFLLQSGADLNAISVHGYTPLHIAAQYDRQKVARVLLDYCADVDITDVEGKTSLYYASEIASVVLVNEILRHNPAFNIKYNRLALHAAIGRLNDRVSGCHKVIKNLLHFGFNVKPEDINDSNLILSCITHDYGNILKDLLKFGLDSNSLLPSKQKLGHTLLHCAVSAGRLNVTSLLLQYGANVNAKDKKGRTPIYSALERDDKNMIQCLLSHGSNVKHIIEPMHIAVKMGNLEVVKMLLEYGCDVDIPDENGVTPLSLAVSIGNKEIPIFLISKGADILSKHQNSSRAVLHEAAFKGCECVIRLLLGNVDIDVRDEMGMTPFFYAALGGHIIIVNMFLEYGVDINFIDNFGRTALHMASRSGNSEIVEIMLESGADVNITDTGGLTPLNVAIYGAIAYPNLPILETDEFPGERFSTHDMLIEMYIKHMALMKSMNLYLSDSNLMILSQMPYSCFHQKCEEEIKSMKRLKNDLAFSFYDFLTKGIYEIAMYMKNEKFIEVLEQGYFMLEFPIYANMLERKCVRGEIRGNLLHLCEVKLNSHFKVLFPYVVMHKILKYLDEKDMKNLVNAL